MRAARVGIVERPYFSGLGIVLPDGGDRVGHRAEMNGNVLGLRDHATTFVEERGRAVAPLFDVGGESGANQHRAHLLRDRAQETADDLELDRHCLVSRSMRPSLTPTHPGASQQVAPGSATSEGPATLVCSVRGRSRSGPGRMSAVRTATSSTSHTLATTRSRSAKPYCSACARWN